MSLKKSSPSQPQHNPTCTGYALPGNRGCVGKLGQMAHQYSGARVMAAWSSIKRWVILQTHCSEAQLPSAHTSALGRQASASPSRSPAGGARYQHGVSLSARIVWMALNSLVPGEDLQETFKHELQSASQTLQACSSSKAYLLSRSHCHHTRLILTPLAGTCPGQIRLRLVCHGQKGQRDRQEG